MLYLYNFGPHILFKERNRNNDIIKSIHCEIAFKFIFRLPFLPASPKAKAGLGVQSLRPSVCLSVRPSQNLVIATPLKLLIQLS